MRPIVVSGIDTEVGKTLVSALLVQALEADYWKPIQSGAEEGTDSECVAKLAAQPNLTIHPEAYCLQAPLSPHTAAELEGVTLDPSHIQLPTAAKPLIVELAGGLLAPLTDESLIGDIAQTWDPIWIIVSRNYLGSINHTLLTVEALRHRGAEIFGLIFGGDPDPSKERTILAQTGLPCLAHLGTINPITPDTLRSIAETWKQQAPFQSLRSLAMTNSTSGTRTPRPKPHPFHEKSPTRKAPSSTQKTGRSISMPSPHGG